MKFYVKVKSEPASKGQGGNKYPKGIFLIGDEKPGAPREIAWFQMGQFTGGNVWLKVRSLVDETPDFFIEIPSKGKRQKGEVDASGQNCIYQHDHSAEPEKCVWHD